MARDAGSWRETFLSFLLATVGMVLLLGGGGFGLLAQRSVSSSQFDPDPSAGTTIAVSYLIAVVGLILIVCAFWQKKPVGK
jgi:hypothetical protein